MNLAGIDMNLSLYAAVAYMIVGLGLSGMILFVRAKLVSTAPCKIRINHDDAMTKTVSAGQTLLSALTSAGVPIPSPCGGKATCKQCRIRVMDGAGEALETDKATFTKKDISDGWRLSCQCKVKGDLHVEVHEELMGVKEWIGTVISNKNVATFIKELVVEVPSDVPYRSGGYLQFHVPPFKTNTSDWKATIAEMYRSDWDKFGLFNNTVDFSKLPPTIRAYSMASYPAEGRKVMFNIRIATPPFKNGRPDESIPWGICSSYTFSLKAGDKVHLSGPYGESFMIYDERPVIFLIGGAGSSFGRSHILQLFKTDKTKRKVQLWYGARSLKENIYQDEYEALAKEAPNFSYHLVLSEPLPDDIAKGWPKSDPVKTNFLFKAFELGALKKMDEPEGALYYVCGPPLHNKSVMKLLDEYGVPPDSIILDDFGS